MPVTWLHLKNQVTWNLRQSPGIKNGTKVQLVKHRSWGDGFRDPWLLLLPYCLMGKHTYASSVAQRGWLRLFENRAQCSRPVGSNTDLHWLRLKRPGLLGTGSGMMGLGCLKWSHCQCRMLIWKGNASQEREPIVCVLGGRGGGLLSWCFTPLMCCTWTPGSPRMRWQREESRE